MTQHQLTATQTAKRIKLYIKYSLRRGENPLEEFLFSATRSEEKPKDEKVNKSLNDVSRSFHFLCLIVRSSSFFLLTDFIFILISSFYASVYIYTYILLCFFREIFLKENNRINGMNVVAFFFFFGWSLGGDRRASWQVTVRPAATTAKEREDTVAVSCKCNKIVYRRYSLSVMGLMPETGQAFENFFQGCEWRICLSPFFFFLFFFNFFFFLFSAYNNKKRRPV